MDRASNNNAQAETLLKRAQETSAKIKEIKEQIGTVFFGQEDVLDLTLACMVAKGHLLLEGVPGTAKTTLVKAISQAMGFDWERIQFTPDTFPSDVIGKQVYNPKTGEVDFEPGPIFTQFVLADEINRAPPKTQSALLEAMEERQVTVGTESKKLPRPFFVMGTQNPVEQEGTYPLPEAQLDRFLIKLTIDYPDSDTEERIMVEKTAAAENWEDAYEQLINGEIKDNDAKESRDLAPVIQPNELQAMQTLAPAVAVPGHIVNLIKNIVRDARPNTEGSSDAINEYVKVGPGPRAHMAFMKVAKAKALMDGRIAVNEDDIKTVLKPVIKHRIAFDYKAQIAKEGDGNTPEELIDNLFKQAKAKQKHYKPPQP